MISIIFANRNREVKRIKASLDSLVRQSDQRFEVIFVDYGSDPALVKEYEALCDTFKFVRFFSLKVSQLLWNKSKALNYGIQRAASEWIFIADVDLIFSPDTFKLLNNLTTTVGRFYLFKLGYLDKDQAKKLYNGCEFKSLRPIRFGKVNGMILASRQAFLEVNGLDEFFHFYGAEDEDLFCRLENAGYMRVSIEEENFYHNWHQSFSGSEDKLLTGNPRVKNIMRINQRHYQENCRLGVIKPGRQDGMGKVIDPEYSQLLNEPTKIFRISNILAHVEHFLNAELPTYKGEIVKAEFCEDPYYNSWKYRIKKLMGKETQPYCSIKEINDMLLKKIVFVYRDYNYSFKVGSNLKSINFIIQV